MYFKRSITSLVAEVSIATLLLIEAAHSADVIRGIPVHREREAYYGDLHLFTVNAFTGYLMGVHLTPEDAYRFARGELVTIDGKSIKRKSPPLDFLAVTDPGEYLGVFNTLYDPNSPFSRTELGRELRNPATRPTAGGKFFDTALYHRGAQVPWLGLDPQLVKKTMDATWQEEVGAADRHYRAGTFTTFIAYHWTAKVGGTRDRVVIFGGDKAPLPFTSLDSFRPEDLWTYLEGCRRRGYEVLAIPHNSNISNGLAFNGLDSDGKPIDRAYAERRAANEPVVEISSNGQSETLPQLSASDEFADFEMFGNEKLDNPRGSYVRDALGRGMEIAQRTGGINPYKLGFVGGTDFHGALSDAAEDASASVPDAVDPTKPLTERDLQEALKSPNPYGAGSLAGVWAEQNTREAIFAALRRKETFATSGTRLKFRFFGGWNFDDTTLKSKDWVKAAYRNGVPMGGDLPANPRGQLAPTFIAWAKKDPLGANLDRLQIIKLWLENGRYSERIYDVALSGGRQVDPTTGRAPAVGNTVNLRNATYTNTIGTPELAVVWRDPNFDRTAPAAYYLRVLEIPTPRWSTIAAIKTGIRPLKELKATIQERGWSSPVWFTPPAK